jgi:hypothetical protein
MHCVFTTKGAPEGKQSRGRKLQLTQPVRTMGPSCNRHSGQTELAPLLKSRINSDVVYYFTPQPLYPSIKCFSHQSMTAQVQSVIRSPAYLILNEKDNSWAYVICGAQEGWIKVEPFMLQSHGPLQRCESVDLYKDWKGKAVFWFRGRLMLGSDAKLFYMTNVWYLVTVATAFYAIIPNMYYTNLFMV